MHLQSIFIFYTPQHHRLLGFEFRGTTINALVKQFIPGSFVDVAVSVINSNVLPIIGFIVSAQEIDLLKNPFLALDLGMYVCM